MAVVVICIALLLLGVSRGQEGNDGSSNVPTNGGNPYKTIELDKKLLLGSRWAVDQAKEGKIIEVYHAIEIVDISKVDVETMSVRVEIHLRQRWEADDLELPAGLFEENDPKDTFIRANPTILNSMWSPDSYIPVARDTKIASLSTSQSVVNIFRNRTIVYKARLYTILGCAFSFQWYPLDKQACNLTVESYTLTDTMVRYLWEDQQPDLVIAKLKLLQYDIKLPIQHENGSAERWGRSEMYPYIFLELVFERQLGHHIIQVFIPTTLVVIISWFSFWLGMDAVPGRVSLLITCMLTLVTMHTGLKAAIPPVNYIKMQDIWMVGCMAFVFMALCEFIIVKYIHWRRQREMKAQEEKEKTLKEYMSRIKTDKGGGGARDKDALALWAMGAGPRPGWDDPYLPLQTGYFAGPGGYGPNPQAKKTPVWVTVDKISRVLFPAAFAIFNGVYWPILLIGAKNQDY